MKVRISVTSALAATAAALAPGALRAQTPTPPPANPAPKISPDLISRADALKLVLATIEECERRGQHPAALVIDADGYQRAMVSDDLGPSVGIDSAGRKAAAALAFKASSGDLAARIKVDPAFAAQYGKDNRYYFMPGALPLYKAGKFVGVLAAGGGHDIDEQCALGAVKAVAWVSITGAN